MSSPFLRLSLSFSLCVAAGALAETLQAPYSAFNYAALGSSSWPTTSVWAALNTTVGGRLQTLRPWAAVCYTKDPLYNSTACETVLSNYKNDYTRESIPSALLWPNWESCGYNNGCALNYSNPQPVSGATCEQGTTPPYSIAISSAQDASAIIQWAITHKVKLSIKNTGHDYLGRSSGPSTLQVLTHNLNSIAYVPDFVPQGSSAAPIPAITLGSGAQLYNIYAAAEANNISAVLGACQTVGAAGGFVQGGGHGVLSPAYGIGADRVVEVEIVTADGVIRTANAVQNSDLFWAIRGGGAGSWGIITSMTLATLPQLAISASLLVIVPTSAQSLQTLGVNFIALVGKYQNQFINSGVTTSFLFLESEYILNFYWPAEMASVSLFYPFFEEVLALSSDYTVAANSTQEYMFPSVSAAQQQNIGPFFDGTSVYGASTELASRFVPQSMLEDSQSIQAVSEAIWAGLQTVSAPLQSEPSGTFSPQVGVFILGDMPAGTSSQVNETGANPGLYEASWHVVYAAAWTVGASLSTYLSVTNAIYDALIPLESLGLTSSYQNEGSPWEVNWQEAFFGYKYAELQQIKQKYDPSNYFTTYKGVGSVIGSTAYSCYESDQS